MCEEEEEEEGFRRLRNGVDLNNCFDAMKQLQLGDKGSLSEGR